LAEYTRKNENLFHAEKKSLLTSPAGFCKMDMNGESVLGYSAKLLGTMKKHFTFRNSTWGPIPLQRGNSSECSHMYHFYFQMEVIFNGHQKV